MTKFTRPLLTASLLGLSLNASALPFATYEARSAGVGTTGVASSNIASAPFTNPAMLAAQRFEDDFSLTAGLGVQAIDNENLLDDIEDFSDADDANDTADVTDPDDDLLSAGLGVNISGDCRSTRRSWATTTTCPALYRWDCSSE